MTSHRLLVLCATVTTFILVAAGCKKITTEPTFEPQLLLDPIRVAIVTGGSEDVKVTSTDEHDSLRSFLIECDPEGIVDVSQTDTTVTVTGLAVGTTNITVTSDTNRRTIPVEVYDPMVQDVGELLIAFVDSFDFRWDSDQCTTYSDTAAFYHPRTTGGFKPLGTAGDHGLSSLDGKCWAMVVKAKPGSDALKPPVDFEELWNSSGAGGVHPGSFWNPIPPNGYLALGTVANTGYTKPSVDDVVCVRADLTVAGAIGERFYAGVSGNGERFRTYFIDAPDAGPHDSCYLTTGAFLGMDPANPQPSYPVQYVLKVKVRKMAEAADQSFAPKLTGYDAPPGETPPLLAKELSVPWTIVKDAAWNQMQRLANSPNYRLERQVYYKCLYHNYNQTSVEQENSVTITSGVTVAKSQEWSLNTGMSVTAEAGVDFLFGSAKVSATVSVDLGYSRQTSIEEFNEISYQTGVKTPPAKAAALWQKYNRFILKRQNGTKLEKVHEWEFGINSYVTDEYPDE